MSEIIVRNCYPSFPVHVQHNASHVVLHAGGAATSHRTSHWLSSGLTLTLVPHGADEIHPVHVPPVPVGRKGRSHPGHVGADGCGANTPGRAETRSHQDN